MGKSLGIRSSRPKKAANVPALEAAYAKSTRLDHARVSEGVEASLSSSIYVYFPN